MKTIKRRHKLKNKTIKGGNNEATLVVRRSNINDDELVYNFFVRRIGIPSMFDLVGTQMSLVDEGLSYIKRKKDKPTDKKPTDEKTANELYRQTIEFGRDIDKSTRKKMDKLEKNNNTENELIKRRTEVEDLKLDGFAPTNEKRISRSTTKID